MATNVNGWFDSWTNMGSTSPVPKYSARIRIEWVDDSGTPHVNDEVRVFPNILSDTPLSVLREYIEDILLKEARRKLGIDDAEQIG